MGSKASKAEKKRQLGMDPGTANYRLTRDLLWNFILVTGCHHCYRCGEEMTRENFSIEHVKPWLHSEDPLGLYFDIDNISYSHQSCNYSAGSRPNKIYESQEERIRVKSRRRYWSMSPEVRKQRRREQYLRTGN